MKGEKFRLSQPTCGVASLKRQITVIPPDSVIEVLMGKEDDHQMVEVDWKGERMRVFVRDIQDRGIQVRPPSRDCPTRKGRRTA